MGELGIVLADDHPIVRDGLCQALATSPDLRVLCACSNCAEAVDAVKHRKPDILILDASLPDRDGVSAIPEILQASPGTHIIVFTATVGEERAVEALRLGAKAVLLKSTSANQLIETIKAVASGTDWIAPSAAGTPVRNEAPTGSDSNLAKLTPREREIADRVAVGGRNKQIAWDLGIAEGTVKLHISRVFRKLGVDSRVGLSRALVETSGR